MSETIGKTLTERRVQKGLSIEDLSKLTRMNQKFIKAAEDDRYGDLPGIVFTKGLLRACAKELGLSGDEIVATYKALNIKHKDNSPEFISVPLYKKPSGTPRFLFPLLFALLLYGLVQFVSVPAPEDKEKPSTSAVLEETVVATTDIVTEPAPDVLPETEIEEPEITETVTEEKTEVEETTSAVLEEATPTVDTTKPAPTPEDVKTKQPEETKTEPADTTTTANSEESDSSQLQDASKTYYLTLVAEEDTWIKVVVDGEITREIILREGNRTIWWANESYSLSIGNVAATRVFLNGVSVPLKQPASNVIKNLKLPKNVAAHFTEEQKTETQ